MGISTDIMHDFVLQEIKRLYSSYDGWKITSSNSGDSYDTFVSLTRLKDGNREVAKVLVTYKKQITPDLIEAIRTPEKSAEGRIPRFSFAVIVPANADTTALPVETNIVEMRSFVFEGNNLVWLKKPVRKTTDEPVKIPG
jgi:hypothetical protein